MILTLNQLLETDLRGKTVVFETDTVYGLGCLLADKDAVRRIYEIKNREAVKPMAILAANIAQVAPLVIDFTPAEAVAKKYWPGALTLVLPKSSLVPDYVTSGLSTVGIRIPGSPVAIAILERFGPMVVTSLNLSHEPAILSWADAARYDGVADYLVPGPDLHGVASTVYDPIAKRTLRQGAVTISG
ncbi:MAG TPA: threonylcarbamoyl-AMP synthase [Acholeplasmatales bacterium]|nr:threonylcarbamoyl-AMP synthase [Acholeplasmatales bacterium]